MQLYVEVIGQPSLVSWSKCLPNNITEPPNEVNILALGPTLVVSEMKTFCELIRRFCIQRQNFMRLSSIMSRRILKIWLNQADVKQRCSDWQTMLIRVSSIFMSFSKDSLYLRFRHQFYYFPTIMRVKNYLAQPTTLDNDLQIR